MGNAPESDSSQTAVAQSLTLQIDWLLSNLRWLFVVSAALVAAVRPQATFSTPLLLVLVASVAYNLATVFLLSMKRWPRLLSLITLAVDSVLAIALFQVSGQLGSPLLFMAFLPILTASLRYNWVVSLMAASTVGMGYTALSLPAIPPIAGLRELFPLLVILVILYTLALSSGLLSQHLVEAFLQQYRVTAREERDRLEASRDRARLIYELAGTMSRTLSYERVLEAALDVTEAGLRELGADARHVISMVLLLDDDRLRVAASRGLSRPDQRVVLAPSQGIIGRALADAEPMLAEDVHKDPDIRNYDALLSCGQVAALPLRAGYQNFGVLVFGCPTAAEFTPEHLELFQAIADHAIVAIQNALLYSKLLEEKQRILEVDEEARKKLARDLHDGPIQGAAAIAMRANFARRLLDRDPDRSGEEIRRIEELARRTTAEMRHMLFTLRPLVLETQGLPAALKQLVDKMAETHGQNVALEIASDVESLLDHTRQAIVFFIVEEAINNARKHAQAAHIWVRVFQRQDAIVAEIEDDGRGFDVSAIDNHYEERGSLGMVNMRERADLIGASLYVRSAPGQGSRIAVVIPLSPESVASSSIQTVEARQGSYAHGA